jgi:hypothetical protein
MWNNHSNCHNWNFGKEVSPMTLRQFFKGFKESFKEFGESIAGIINVVLLSIVYFIGVGITSIIAKVSGKHFLDMKTKKSYWSDLDQKEKSIEEFYRQF